MNEICKERRPAQIAEQWQLLLEQVDRTEALIIDLQNRLNNIVRTDEAVDTPQTGAPEPHLVPFANAIRTTTRQLQNANTELFSFIERIEL
jgi:hypothetical protein